MGRPPQLARTSILTCCLYLLVVTASASKCTVGCHGMHGGKAYQEGHTYIYDFEGTSVTSVRDAQGDATLKLKALVELSVKPDCIRQLKLKNVQVNGAPVSLQDVEQNPLQFNYHDGHIDTELCTMPEDSQASLNIKRAIVSLFQSAIMQESGSTTHHEVDVFGSCPTDFSFHKDGDSILVHKHRDLSQCSHRENIRHGLISTSFNAAAGMKSFPLLASDQKIEQRFKRGVLSKAVATETYRFRPFGNDDAGVKTVVGLSLLLKGDKAGVDQQQVSQPRSLIFEVPQPMLQSSIDTISSTLKAVSGETSETVKPGAAGKFTELVRVLRMSNKKDMLSVYHKVRAGAGFDKVSDKKILLDALFRAGSGETAEVVTELIMNHEVSDIEALLFYASLSLIQNVNRPSVTAVVSLLDLPDLPRIGYLGVGHVIGKYCQQHACDNVPEVKEATNKIRSKIGNGRTKTREQENSIISALKALGNSRYLDDPTLQKLAGIAADRNVRNRVRVAAIEALPTRCTMKWKNPLFKVLADRDEDSEIRIKAYLSLVSCPCPHVANHLKEILDKETVNQVGSFITSHLRNLRASADPNKQEAKRQLGLIKPRTKFPEDFRKYSFNNELSYHLDAFGIGSAAESNVIYSQNSFVPRSADLNITAEIFGHTVNFLELNTRIENLDRIIEKYFGPKGSVMTHTTHEIVDESMRIAKDAMNQVKEHMDKARAGREKRDVKQGELDKFAKNVKLRGTEVDQDLDIDLSMKLFGVELAYLSYQGDGTEITHNKMIDNIFKALKKVSDKAKNFDYDLRNHMQFLDVELIYPTGLGIPLSLGVDGTSVVHLKTTGKIDIPAILEHPENAAIRVAFEPSASISVTGNIIQDFSGHQSGVKFVTTLHTSTGSDLSLKVLDGKGIDINFGIPKKKQEIINVNSEVLFTAPSKANTPEKYVPAKFGKSKEYSDCFEQFSGLLGLTICGEVVIPYDGLESMQSKGLYSFTGPAKFAVTVENTDINSYHLKAFYDDKNPDARSFEILLDTPNSKKTRRVSLLLEGGIRPNKFIKISFDSPIKKASVEALLKDQPEERTLMITVHNDQMEYYARAGLMKSGSKYKPVLEYRVPEHVEQLSTKKSSRGGARQYNVQGAVDVLDESGGRKYVFDKLALLSGGKKLVSIDGSLHYTMDVAEVDMNIGYGEESLALKLDGKRLAERNYAVSLSAVPSKDPNVGFKLDWKYKRGQTELNNKLVFIHGSDFDSKMNRFTLEQEAVYNIDPKNLKLSGSNKITYPALQLEVDVEGELTGKSLSGEIEVKYEKFKFCTELSAKRDMSKPGDYEIEFEAELLGSGIKLESKRTVINPQQHKSKFQNTLVLKPSGGKYEANGIIVYHIAKNDINLLLDGEFNLNGKHVKFDTALETTSQLLNSRLIITIGQITYIEFVLNGKLVPELNGDLRLNLHNALTAVGHVNVKNEKATGHINIDIPKLNRKIKGNGVVTATGNHYVGNVELFYDAEKDPSKCIKISTISDITKTSVDTRNVIEILSHVTQINGKFKMQGTFDNGHMNADVDITLPNGHYIVYKAKRTVTKTGTKLDANGDVELACHVTKGGQARKFFYGFDIKNFDRVALTIDGKYNIKYIDYDNKDVQVALDLKHLPIDGSNKKAAGVDLDVSGTYLYKPFNIHASSEYNCEGATFAASSALGSDLTMKSSGSISNPEDKTNPYKVNGVLELNLPSEKLRNIKFDISESVLIPLKTNDLFEYNSMNSVTYNDDQTIKVETHLKDDGIMNEMEKGEASGKISLTILKIPTFTVGSTYKHDGTGDLKKDYGTINIDYDNKEATFAIDTAYHPDLSSVDLNAKMTTPFEKMRSASLQLGHKRENGDGLRKTDITAFVNEDKYTLQCETNKDEQSPMIHIIFTCPKGQTELLSKFQKLGDRDYTGEWKVVTPQGFVISDARVNLESVDNFVIDVNFDSDKIEPRKIHAEIANRPGVKTGRKIVITVTGDGKNIVTGSTNYKKRDDDGKVTVEGNGTLMIGKNSRSSSFKFTRQQLSRETDGEVGVAMVFNANFGPSAIVGELKLSNKEVHVFNSYCEQSKDCAHFLLQSTLDTDHKTHLKHQITVEVDLKKFNVPAEFGLKTSTKYREFFFDHLASLYLHSSKDKSQYSYHIYANPQEAAVVLTLPTRELAAVTTFDLPKTKQTGAYKLDASVYLDRKNKPTDKTSLIINGDVNVEKGSLSLSGEAKFIFPSQSKDMAVKGRLHYGGEHLLDANVDIDVFAKKSQKISVVAHLIRQELSKGFNVSGLVEINSRGQQLKVDLKTHLTASMTELGSGALLSYTDQHQKPKSVGALFSANFEEIHLLVTSPNKEIVRSDTKMDINKNVQKIDSELVILGNKAIVSNFEAHDMNNFKYILYCKDNANTKLIANGRVVIGQLAEIHADSVKNGEKKNLFHVLIHLDESKFLKPDFGYNNENIIALIEFIRTRIMNTMKQLKEVSVDIADEVKVELKDLIHHLEKAQPNIKPLLEYYTGELKKLENELHADQTIKEIQATLNKHFGNIIATVTEILKQVTEKLGEMQKQYNVIVSKIVEAIEATYPQFKKSFYTVYESFIGVFDAFMNLAMTYVKAILNVINEHQKELEGIAVMVSEFLQDIAKITFKTVSGIKKDVEQFIVLLINQAKALPIYEMMKEKYQELVNLEVPEVVLSSIDEVYNTVKNMLPTEELRELFSVTYEYVMKIVRRQKVDDEAELKKIYQRAIIALKSLVTLLESSANLDNLSHFLDTRVPIDFGVLTKIPGITTFKISILNLLRNHELPSLFDVYYAYRPTLQLSDIVPPFSKVGMVVDGGHFFTFDGRYLAMSGTCTYVLAQDMRDGNFSVVGYFDGGNLVSITVTEPKESITIKANKNILVNNKPADYPANTKNLHAFLMGPIMNIKSDYGAHVLCFDQPRLMCIVRVSGFYHGKIRGLLGDGNNEPYDDFTLPSGKTTESETEFGNAYKLKQDCPAATAIEHHKHGQNHPRAPKCTEFLSGSTSPLSPGFPYVDPTHYRVACDHATQTYPEAYCLFAAAYHAACYEKRVMGTKMPAACSYCKVGNANVPAGDPFSVKIPKKEADIIFVIEQDIRNEEIFKNLVMPLMSDLRDELKHHGMTDVFIGVIGFGEKMRWPQHYTSGGSSNIAGDIKNMVFHEKEEIISYSDAKEGNVDKKLKFISQRLDVELGTFKLTDAYEEAIRYPYRPGAAKAVIGVIASPCEKSPLPISLQQLRLLLGQKIYRDLGLTYYHMSFPSNIFVSDKLQRNIVGYDHNGVYTFADNKKKPLGGGNADMKENMALTTTDVCADFAISSGGAAFSSNNFLDAKPNQKKQFAVVAARRIAEGLAGVEIEEDCVCRQSHGIIGRSQCKIVGREKKSLARHTKVDVKG